MNKLNLVILKTALIAGTLDILAANIYVFIKIGKAIPFDIFRYIASGIVGKDALSGGDIMIVPGLILHYLIALLFTVFFFWLFPKIKLLSKNKILTGIAYGIFVWMIMNLIVVPLSNVPHRPFDLTNAVINAMILIVCIGFPLSFMSQKFYKKTKA